jgi:hypothetical protein
MGLGPPRQPVAYKQKARRLQRCRNVTLSAERDNQLRCRVLFDAVSGAGTTRRVSITDVA